MGGLKVRANTQANLGVTISATAHSCPAWFGGCRGHNVLIDLGGHFFFPASHFLVSEMRRLDQISSWFYDSMSVSESTEPIFLGHAEGSGPGASSVWAVKP